MKKSVLLFAAVVVALLCSCEGKKVSVGASFLEDVPTVHAFKDRAVPEADLNKILAAGVNAQSAMNGQPWHFSCITDKEVLSMLSEKMKSGMKPKKGDGPDAGKTPPAPGDSPAPAGDMPPAPPAGDMPPAPPAGDEPPAPPAGDAPPAPPAGDVPPAPPSGDMPPSPPSGDVPSAPSSDSTPPAPPAGTGDGKSPAAKANIGDSPVAIVISGRNGKEFDVGLAAELMTVEAISLGYGTKLVSSPTIVLNGADREEYKALLGIPEDMSVKAVLLIGEADQAKSDAVTGASPRNAMDEVVTFIK